MRSRQVAGGLDDFYFSDPRLFLIPIEHLTPSGMTRSFAQLARERSGWNEARVELFNAGFSLYWERTARLAGTTPAWAPPRLRHVAVVLDPRAVRPYVQLLNTSAWLVYDCDFDPERSDREFVAYVLVHGDRMALNGEVTLAAVHDAAYWFDRDQHEIAAFAAAAKQSIRPDAEAFQALAQATEWLRELHHETLRPAQVGTACRPIPGTGLLVPRAIEGHPNALVDRWTTVARLAVKGFEASWRAPDATALKKLLDWLRDARPPGLITARGGRIVWDPIAPARLGSVRNELRPVGGAALGDIAADLRTVERHTRAFHAALRDASALPAPSGGYEERGYTYLHPTRGMIAYNLHEQGVDRLIGPALPYAREMLGARTAHEWAHLAVDAGWVPRTVDDQRFAELAAAFAAELDRVIAGAPRAIRALSAPDVEELSMIGSIATAVDRSAHGPGSGLHAGSALVEIFLARMRDYQANLLATRLMTVGEREAYVRHNIRTLRKDYPPERIWRMLVRYLYEYQYLSFSQVSDPFSFFVRSTWFDADFFANRILDEQSFARLSSAARLVCASYAIDEARFCFAAEPPVGI